MYGSRRLRSTVRGWTQPLATLLSALALAPALAHAQAVVEFDHFRTRFPLNGAHERVACETCHPSGTFAGTPTRCAICHDGSGLRSDSGKDTMHIRSTENCDDCHLLAAWLPSRIDHDAVLGSCQSCHNGFVAPGKSDDHPPSSNLCEDCHRTTTWLGARFDHAGITARCATCHDGISAQGKPMDHIQSSNLCEDCHGVTSWSNARFDHSNVTGSCGSCHDGQTATGKDSGHFVTTQDCADCHSPTRWRPSTFRHTSPDYPGDHSGSPACVRCHGGNSATVSWRSPSYQPDCAGCHASDFETGPHKKVDSPRISYTVSELRDCTGACHMYTDATFTTIERFRSGEHRARDGEF